MSPQFDRLRRGARQALRLAPALIGLLLASASAGTGSDPQDRFLLSSEGSGRATAYLESPKIATFGERTHVAWLDTPPEGFRVRIRTLDHKTGEWSEAWTIGEAHNNHGGPALTVDREGYLHVLYFSHHHPFRYRRSVNPNDASAWMPYEEFGEDLTYPALVCAEDGTLILTARRSYEEQPWELEMWKKPAGRPWERVGTLLRARYPGYAQFAASLAWGPDHQRLHLGMRIYEMAELEEDAPFTTIGYLVSPDGGTTWEWSNGRVVDLPATAETVDRIASGRAGEGRILNGGSIDVNGAGTPFVPYSVHVQDSSQAYLATPWKEDAWRHRHLNPFLPEGFRDWSLFMHGGIAFGASGVATLVGTVMQVAPDGLAWGEPSMEVVRMRSSDNGHTFSGMIMGRPDPDTPRWMPNIERPTGFNRMPERPSFIFTEGVRGESLDDRLSNRVWWIAD